jgi:catecholate siderophore receptor
MDFRFGLRWDDYSEQTMTYGARNSAVIANPATAKAGDKVKTENDLIFQHIKQVLL